jgi:transcriptional regulator with XRE-family HTH domain
MRDRQPTVRARELGLTLARAAQAKGLSNNELARRLAWSDSRVSRLFSGKRNVNTADLAAILAICGVKPPKREELLELGQHALERGWWQDHGDRLPPEIATLSSYEDAAISITNFETVVVPGLLQTPDYVRALIRRSRTIPDTETEVWIMTRGERQQVFNRQHPAHFVFFLDEYSLSRTGPGRDVMSDQVHHLLRMAVRPNVEIRIIPDAVGFHATHKPFKLMSFNELDPVVFVETDTSSLFLEKRETLAAYRRIEANLATVALDERQSREWLARLATDLGGPREEHDEHASPLEEEFPQ